MGHQRFVMESICNVHSQLNGNQNDVRNKFTQKKSIGYKIHFERISLVNSYRKAQKSD